MPTQRIDWLTKFLGFFGMALMAGMLVVGFLYAPKQKSAAQNWAIEYQACMDDVQIAAESRRKGIALDTLCDKAATASIRERLNF